MGLRNFVLTVKKNKEKTLYSLIYISFQIFCTSYIFISFKWIDSIQYYNLQKIHNVLILFTAFNHTRWRHTSKQNAVIVGICFPFKCVYITSFLHQEVPHGFIQLDSEMLKCIIQTIQTSIWFIHTEIEILNTFKEMQQYSNFPKGTPLLLHHPVTTEMPSRGHYGQHRIKEGDQLVQTLDSNLHLSVF